jgi:hypothetical protein
MGFFSAWFLGGLAFLGIPVFVHLLRRHVTTPRPVSSLMFFERGIQSSARHRRLRHLVLFALRFALILLVVLAFADPFLRRASTNTAGSLLVIALDNSFSMRAADRFARAKRDALSLLKAKPPSQRALILSLGGQIQILNQPTADTALLQSGLEGIQPGDGHASFGELARAIRGVSEANHGAIDLHLFSDLQRSAMPANFADLALPTPATLHLHSAAPGAVPPNWTVESVAAPEQLSDPKDPQHSRVRAVVAGFNTLAATKVVSLTVNGKVLATRNVSIPVNGRATVEFAPLDVGYGFNRCEVRIEGNDALPADDAAFFAVRRSDPERVLFVHAARDVRSATYFGAALKAGSQSSFILQSVSQEQSADFDPTRFAFVVLSDAVSLPAIFEHSLSQFVSRGGSVLIVLGPDAPRGTRIPLWNGSVLQTRDFVRDGGGISVGQIDFSHPAMLDPQPNRDNGGWAETKFQYAALVDAHDARIAAQLADGTPLLLEKHMGQGRLLLFTSGFDNLTNDLPLHPVFVAFVDRMARLLSDSNRPGGAMLVDSYVQLQSGLGSAGQSSAVEVIDPGGHRPLSLNEARAAQSLRLERAGFYQIRFANGRDTVIGVNPDRLESDLKPIPDDLQQLWAAGQNESQPGNASIGTAKGSLRSISLWWYVVLLAFLVALAETALATSYMGTQREEI